MLADLVEQRFSLLSRECATGPSKTARSVEPWLYPTQAERLHTVQAMWAQAGEWHLEA